MWQIITTQKHPAQLIATSRTGVVCKIHLSFISDLNKYLRKDLVYPFHKELMISCYIPSGSNIKLTKMVTAKKKYLSYTSGLSSVAQKQQPLTTIAMLCLLVMEEVATTSGTCPA